MSTLIGIGLITKPKNKFVTNKNKIFREKYKTRTILNKFAENDIEIKCLYFDGRKDDTVIQVKNIFVN